ncbi:hypothetical protein D3C78_993560 [compost metagenome]
MHETSRGVIEAVRHPQATASETVAHVQEAFLGCPAVKGGLHDVLRVIVEHVFRAHGHGAWGEAVTTEVRQDLRGDDVVGTGDLSTPTVTGRSTHEALVQLGHRVEVHRHVLVQLGTAQALYSTNIVGVARDFQRGHGRGGLTHQHSSQEHEALFSPAVGDQGRTLGLGQWTDDLAGDAAQGGRGDVGTATGVMIELTDQGRRSVRSKRTQLHVTVARALTEYEFKQLHVGSPDCC